ncbi:unnamed protein product [Prunus armeniaca]|uniref:Uncharacterized protein n=1 Tax=Prunus armeniaca TaxID=36596 RepID=A0A6J5TM72_PRUAR|nr:unnamed protein product [Prunus armeniaca]CAB4294692.1 unnamed protein product [Prunus armeniaca]
MYGRAVGRRSFDKHLTTRTTCTVRSCQILGLCESLIKNIEGSVALATQFSLHFHNCKGKLKLKPHHSFQSSLRELGTGNYLSPSLPETANN